MRGGLRRRIWRRFARFWIDWKIPRLRKANPGKPGGRNDRSDSVSGLGAAAVHAGLSCAGRDDGCSASDISAALWQHRDAAVADSGCGIADMAALPAGIRFLLVGGRACIFHSPDRWMAFHGTAAIDVPS